MSTARIAAEAAIEAVAAGASMYPLWEIADALPAPAAGAAREVLLDTIAASLDAWDAAGHPRPNVSNQGARTLVVMPPKARRFGLAAVAALPGGNEVVEALCDTVRRMSIHAKFTATIDAGKPEQPQPQKIVIQNHLPEQPAPVVNVTNHLPEQPAPVVHAPVSVQVPDRLSVDISSMPERVTDTTVSYDRDGNVKETLQIERDG